MKKSVISVVRSLLYVGTYVGTYCISIFWVVWAFLTTHYSSRMVVIIYFYLLIEFPTDKFWAIMDSYSVIFGSIWVF